MTPGTNLDQLLGRIPACESDYHIVYLPAHGQHWIWIYADDQALQVCRSAGKMASDPKLDLTWWDAAMISSRVREVEKAASRKR